MIAVIIISLIIFLVLIFYIFKDGSSHLSKLKKEYKNLKLESVINTLVTLKRDGIFIDDIFLNEVAIHFGVNKETLIGNSNSEIFGDSNSKMSVGDMLIESGNHYKKALNSIFICFFIELILFLILYQLYQAGPYNTVYTVDGKKEVFDIFFVIISVIFMLVPLFFLFYFFINKYSAANYLKKAGMEMNLKKFE